MNAGLIAGGCLFGLIATIIYLLMVYAVYWVIDYYFDFPTLVSVVLAWLVVSALGGVANGAR